MLRKTQILRVNNSRSLTIKNAKLSGCYFFSNLNVQGDFQICISVPLIWKTFLFTFTQKKYFRIYCQATRTKSIKQKAKSIEQRAKTNEQQAKSNTQQANSNEQQTKSNEQRAKTNEQQAKINEQRETTKKFHFGVK